MVKVNDFLVKTAEIRQFEGVKVHGFLDGGGQMMGGKMRSQI